MFFPTKFYPLTNNSLKIPVRSLYQIAQGCKILLKFRKSQILLLQIEISSIIELNIFNPHFAIFFPFKRKNFLKQSQNIFKKIPFVWLFPDLYYSRKKKTKLEPKHFFCFILFSKRNYSALKKTFFIFHYNTQKLKKKKKEKSCRNSRKRLNKV